MTCQPNTLVITHAVSTKYISENTWLVNQIH